MPPANSDIFATSPVRQERPYHPSPFDGILEKCRDLICERLDEAVALMLDSAHEIITQLIKDTQIREEWRLYEEARTFATEKRETIEKHFRSAYRADFQRRSDRARKIGKPFDRLDCSFEKLELIGEDDYDETLKFNDMAQRLRNYCDEELSALESCAGWPISCRTRGCGRSKAAAPARCARRSASIFEAGERTFATAWK